MIVIIEGMDNCGKSTLIRSLMKKNPNPNRTMVHSTSPPDGVDAKDWSYQHYMHVLSVAMCQNSDTYFDRAHIGECVYGPIYRGTDPSWVYDELEADLGLDQTHEDVFLIVLVATNAHMAMYNDGLNISDDNWDQERDLFTKGYARSKIEHKLLITLDRDFRWLEDQVSKFIQENECG